MLSNKFVILILSSFFLMPGLSASATLNVMVLANQSFADAYPGWAGIVEIANYVNWTNQAMTNSRIDVKLNVVHGEIYSPANSAEVSQVLRDSLVKDAVVNDRRNTHKPDLTIYLTRASSSLCGIAFLPDLDKDRSGKPIRIREAAFKGIAVVGYNCGAATFAHEIGHNLGVGHGQRQGHPGYPYAYSRGWGVDGSFRTIMPYSSAYPNSIMLQYHSNPNVTGCFGMACGTYSDNAASGIQSVVELFVQYYSSCYPTTRKINRDGNWSTICGNNICKTDGRSACAEWE